MLWNTGWYSEDGLTRLLESPSEVGLVTREDYPPEQLGGKLRQERLGI